MQAQSLASKEQQTKPGSYFGGEKDKMEDLPALPKADNNAGLFVAMSGLNQFSCCTENHVGSVARLTVQTCRAGVLGMHHCFQIHTCNLSDVFSS